MNSGLKSAQVSEPLSLCVVGAGYVGLTAAACLAQLGHFVYCLEADSEKVSLLSQGEIPIYEPGLKELVEANLANQRLKFTCDPSQAIENATVGLLCVGTPPRFDGDPDLSQLSQAGRTLVQSSDHDLILVVKSTVPPGSCEALELIFQDTAEDRIRVNVCSNPEFLRESHAVWDFFNPDRIVLGVDEPSLVALDRLYPSDWPIIKTDRRSAELVKYASNAFLAIKISFANELADLCSKVGANAEVVLAGVGADQRIGSQFLKPGPGYGGSCLPKDISGFIAVGEAVNLDLQVASAARKVNTQRSEDIAQRIETVLGGLSNKKIALLGLSFKGGTDDTRYSPAIGLAEVLVEAGAEVVAYDPLANIFGKPIPFFRVESPYVAVEDADGLVIATDWEEFGKLDYQYIAKLMRGYDVFDLVSKTDSIKLGEAGLNLYGLGKGFSIESHSLLWTSLLWAM